MYLREKFAACKTITELAAAHAEELNANAEAWYDGKISWDEYVEADAQVDRIYTEFKEYFK